MTHTPHELAAEFPLMIDRIRDLKSNDAHFAQIAGEYHRVNRELHRIEAEIETPSDNYTETLKKQRLKLKDEIAEMLAA